MRRGGTLTEHTREAWRPHLGTIDSRTSCVGACRLMASVDCVLYCASLAIALGTPTVEMVMWRAPIFMVLFMNSCACITDGRLSSGSPIPMKTMLLTRVPNSSWMWRTWSMISYGMRLRAKPPLPVAQKVQRMGQPTWEEMHAVSRLVASPSSSLGMPTVSTTRPSCSLSSSLVVPHGDLAVP